MGREDFLTDLWNAGRDIYKAGVDKVSSPIVTHHTRRKKRKKQLPNGLKRLMLDEDEKIPPPPKQLPINNKMSITEQELQKQFAEMQHNQAIQWNKFQKSKYSGINRSFPNIKKRCYLNLQRKITELENENQMLRMLLLRGLKS